MKEVTKTMVVPVESRTAFEVVADFGRYPEFLGDHRRAEVASRAGDSVTMSFNIQIIKDFEFLVRHQLAPYSRISWVHEKGPFKHCEGSWSFTPSPDGRDVQITYRIALDPGFFIPDFIVRRLIEISLPTTLDRFKQRMLAVSGG